jgi:hypothetical protein
VGGWRDAAQSFQGDVGGLPATPTILENIAFSLAIDDCGLPIGYRSSEEPPLL